MQEGTRYLDAIDYARLPNRKPGNYRYEINCHSLYNGFSGSWTYQFPTAGNPGITFWNGDAYVRIESWTHLTETLK